MFQQMMRDVSGIAAWAKSNWHAFLNYSGSVGLLLLNAAIILGAAFSPTLIALALAPSWTGVALAGNVLGLVVAVYLVSLYERSR